MTAALATSFLDIDIAAKTVYGEARGESYQGKQAVAWSIRNRVARALDYMRRMQKIKHPQYGSGTLQSACLAAWQYSCWNADDPNYRLIAAPVDMRTLWLRADGYPACLNAVLDVVNGLVEDMTCGATHYFDARMTRWPNWSNGLKPICTIGNHQFYNNVT